MDKNTYNIYFFLFPVMHSVQNKTFFKQFFSLHTSLASTQHFCQFWFLLLLWRFLATILFVFLFFFGLAVTMSLNLHMYCDNVTLWFSQLNTYFTAHNITPSQQLNILYFGMSTASAHSIWDLITDLIQMQSIFLSRLKFAETCFRTLMQVENLGDRS